EQGISELAKSICDLLASPQQHRNYDFCSGGLHKAIHSISHIVEDESRDAGMSVRYVAGKLVAHDPDIPARLGIPAGDMHVIEHIVENLEAEYGQDSETVLASMRYNYVDELCRDCIKQRSWSREQERSDRIDRYLTNKFWGIPIFLGIMGLVFWLTFSVIGGPLQELLEWLFDVTGAWLGQRMIDAGISYWVYDLVINGAWAGVCSVLSFLPLIMVLFFFLSLLEDSGYMTRVSFVMDKLLRKVGISGRSFAPLLVGFGCNVPAIMATRSLPSERDRKFTVLLIPFMSCSAKLPVYAMITAAFFKSHGALVMVSLYVMGVLVALLLALILSRTVFKGDAMMYVMELPAYRMPALSDVLRHMWDNAREFVRKAFTIIFLGTIVIWFLQNFDLSFAPVVDSADSILAFIGTKLSVIFAPLGLGNWQATTALLAGLVAKEAIVSTLMVLLAGGAEAGLTAALATIFTPLTAYTFLVFILLYVPCIATFAATRKELGSTMQALGALAMQLCVAYIVAFIVYHIGLLLV
ncbi:MAG: ferrous iron transport protein B, partial [Coriobacteriales bacterium]|nr:ferrous iron transport protein B [Coriobacteriales bacterium]